MAPPSFTLAAALAILLTLCVVPTNGFSTPAMRRSIFSSCSGCATDIHHFRMAAQTTTTLFQSTADVSKVSDATADGSSAASPLLDAVVCGGGPAGLLSAIMLAKNFNYKVKVYERLPAPPSPTDESVWCDIAKFYLIGLGERGQAALKEFGVWDDVQSVCTSVPGRMDWAPDAGPDEGVERIFTDRPIMTQVLPRDKLVGVLHQHILQKYQGQISLEYQKEVTPIDFDNDGSSSVSIGVSNCATEVLRDTPSNVGMKSVSEEALCDADSFELINTKLLVAADGTQRNIANAMEKADKEKRDSMSFIDRLKYGPSFHVKRYDDDNQRVYKTIPIKVPSKWKNNLNLSARSKDGRILFDSLPADQIGNQCAVLLLKRDDELAQENSDPKKLREAFDKVLPQFSTLLDDDMIKEVAKKRPSFLPSFRYVAPRLNQGDRTVILGDAIHTVKPYFGLGANSALEDVQILKRSIENTNTMKEATRLFSSERADESRALVEISRELDRPGLMGVFTFIIPLIVDSIFNKFAPRIFSPNTIAMLQKSTNTFQGIRRRKRLELLGKVSILGSFVTALGMGARQLIRILSRVSGKRNTTVVVVVMASLANVAFAKKIATFFSPGQAPADVLNKTGAKIMEEEDDRPLRTVTAYKSEDEDNAANLAGGGI